MDLLIARLFIGVHSSVKQKEVQKKQSTVVFAVKNSSFPILHMCNQLKKKINRWHLGPTILSAHWLVREMEY